MPPARPTRRPCASGKVWVEPLFAEGKEWHGLRRFRLRRLVAGQQRGPLDWGGTQPEAAAEAGLGSPTLPERGGDGSQPVRTRAAGSRRACHPGQVSSPVEPIRARNQTGISSCLTVIWAGFFNTLQDCQPAEHCGQDRLQRSEGHVGIKRKVAAYRQRRSHSVTLFGCRLHSAVSAGSPWQFLLKP